MATGKQLTNFDPAAPISDDDQIFIAQGGARAGIEKAATAAQLATYVQAPLANGSAPDAGPLTGSETVSVSRGAGLLQTVWNSVAEFALSIFTLLMLTAAGAVKRSIVGKLLDIAITPHDFGAVGDGVTDDTAALQAWLNAANGGRQLTCVPGSVYGFTNLTLPSPTPYTAVGANGVRGFAMVIDGQSATLKKIAAGSDAAYGIASVKWLTNTNGVNSPIRISDLNIDLNGFATVAGLITQHWNSVYERVNVFNAAGDGHMQVGSTRNGTTVSSTLNNNRWSGCNWYSNGGSGLHIYVPSLSNNADGIIENCYGIDNALANVKHDIPAAWTIKNLHCWNFVVPQTDLGVTVWGACNTTQFIGCQFDVDGTNASMPSCYISGGSISLAATFAACYFFAPLAIANAQTFRIVYALDAACQFKNTYLHFLGPNITVTDGGTGWLHPTPIISDVAPTSPNPSTVYSKAAFWHNNKVYLEGQHLLTKGAAAPYTGGYSYVPLVSHKYSTVASGATYAMGYADPLLQMFATPLTANITYQLPPKSNISDFQKPFVFQRLAAAMGAFSILIVDVDTGATIA
jgi:hypothetical protein